MILIIPSAQTLDYEMQSETGACTHALINLAGKPLFVHIVECYQKIIGEENLTVILIVKTGVKKLIRNYIECIDKCIETSNSIFRILGREPSVSYDNWRFFIHFH